MLPIRKTAFTVRAAKLPVGVISQLTVTIVFSLRMIEFSSSQVEMPKMKPKLAQPFLGFTNTAEIWNSRACMIGLIGTFIVELVGNLVLLFIFSK